MTFSATGAEVDLLDDHDRKRAFMTDRRKLQKSKDYNYQEIALSPDGRKLYENLHIEGSGRNGRTLDVHYVYDILAERQKN